MNLRHIPANIKNSSFPLTRINPQHVEGIQKGIPLFDGVGIRILLLLLKGLKLLIFSEGVI